MINKYFLSFIFGKVHNRKVFLQLFLPIRIAILLLLVPMGKHIWQWRYWYSSFEALNMSGDWWYEALPKRTDGLQLERARSKRWTRSICRKLSPFLFPLSLSIIHFSEARDKFSIDPWLEVYLVLEEDGTEVDDEEYFQVEAIYDHHQQLKPSNGHHTFAKCVAWKDAIML